MNAKVKKLRILFAGLMLATTLSSCADYTTREALDNPPENADPLEGFNRAMFAVNVGMDRAVIRPVTVVYRAVMPETGRNMVSNFLENLSAPVVFGNSVLQGDQQNSFATFWRFVINTTFGIGGLFDVASSAGLKNRDTDFGQTMAVWGVNSGAYLVLPILGPGTLRDSAGVGVDILMDPVTWMYEDWYSYAEAGARVVDRRSTYFKTFDDLYRSSLDPYVTFRSVYLQRRTAQIQEACFATKPKLPAANAKPASAKSMDH